MITEKLCRVCGYEMEEGPRDYNICPSCGTEFGIHDVNSSIDNLRTGWLATGPRWYSPVIPEPLGWRPIPQLSKLFLNPIPFGWTPAITARPDLQGVHFPPLAHKRRRIKSRVHRGREENLPYPISPVPSVQAA
jgi:hypothetical protein